MTFHPRRSYRGDAPQAGSPVGAIRTRAARLLVLRRGRIVSRCEPVQAKLNLPGRPETVDFLLKRG